MRGGNHHQLFRGEAKGIEPGTVGSAAFSERQVLRNPEDAPPVMTGHSRPKDGVLSRAYVPANHPQSKPNRCRKMSLAGCRDFMECAANKSAAERPIDGGNAEGHGTGTTFDPWRLLQGQQVLTKLLDHY